jgi:uncharacterized protein
VTRPFAPDVVVHVRYTKWGGGDHWAFDGRLLGDDDHGTWVQVPLGTPLAKPGTQITAERHHVILFPHDRAFTAAFYLPLPNDDGDQIAIYVDVSTVPVWAEGTVTMVDLDLDVIATGRHDVKVDDQDEFALHQVLHGYPAEIVTLAEESCAALFDAVRRRSEPFGEEAAPWLAR